MCSCKVFRYILGKSRDTPLVMFPLLEFLGTILEYLGHLLDWRFSVCFFGSIAIAVIAAKFIPSPVIDWVVAVSIVVAGSIVGSHWNRAQE
jgi:hypothetical protein